MDRCGVARFRHLGFRVPDPTSPFTDRRLSVPHADLNDALKILSTPFNLTPRHWRGRAYGMEYIRLDEPDGGRFWITRMGWPRVPYLLPSQWYTNNLFAERGERLKNATASVYRVPTQVENKPPLDLIVKFARFAQDVPIWIDSQYEDKDRVESTGTIRFNSPFEEFGLVSELRRKRYEAGGVPIKTGRPLAIYSPSGTRPLWQLGRTKGRFRPYARDLTNQTQARTLEHAPDFFGLDINREYVLIYEWLKGIDCEQAFEAGLVSDEEMKRLTGRVIQEVRDDGFLILDNKPRHFILRQRKKTGELIRRADGELAYGLIDFELMVRAVPQT